MARIPESIGKYKVESLIAKGGMGAVYKAIHPTLGRPVIIKKLTLKGRKDITERFKREARILMDFRHDGVVNMYDHFKLGTSYYIVLEFIDGCALDSVIKKQRYLDNGTAAYILYKAALALSYAHEKKVIHRDIKPANIILSKTGEVKLVDFGIAVSDKDLETDLTREGMSLGTPGYMAPEQFQNTKNVDLRADIYALGVLTYELCTGKKPFPGFFSPDLVLTIQKGKYPPPRKYNPHIAPVLKTFIRKAMKTDPGKRYMNLGPAIKELERDLKHWDKRELTEAVASLANGDDPVKPRQRKKKHLLLKGLIAVFVICIAASAGLFSYFTGYHNMLLHPSTYNSVAFSVFVPFGAQPPDKIYIKAGLYKDDNKQIPSVSDRRVIFLYTKLKKSGRYRFSSIPVYLPAGAYRAKLEMEDSVSWYSFLVNPKGSSGKKSGTVILVNRIPAEHLETIVSVKALDTVSNRRILDGTSVFLSQRGRWIPMKDSVKLAGGNVYKFMIKHEAYYPKIFSLKIGTGQDILNIKAGLVPLPGTLVLNKNRKGITCTLNGQDHILSADAVPSVLYFNKDLHFKGNLPPARYTLDLAYMKDHVYFPLFIRKGEGVTVTASVDPDTGKLGYEIK